MSAGAVGEQCGLAQFRANTSGLFGSHRRAKNEKKTRLSSQNTTKFPLLSDPFGNCGRAKKNQSKTLFTQHNVVQDIAKFVAVGEFRRASRSFTCACQWSVWQSRSQRVKKKQDSHYTTRPNSSTKQNLVRLEEGLAAASLVCAPVIRLAIARPKKRN